MRIGAHVSIGKGLDRAVQRAVEIGADCIQIFVTAPQQWRSANHSLEAIATFDAARAAAGLDPVLIHSIYLLNLASPDPALRARSVNAVIAHLDWAKRLRTMGVVIHVGTATGADHEAGLNWVSESLDDILAHAPGQAPLLLETTAGQKNSIGGRFEDLGELIRRMNGHPRLRVCLDTAHVFEAGYPCATRSELDQTIDAFDRAIGLERLTALHLNDSKTAFGSHSDRHANIGEGQIGLEGMRLFLHHPALANLPGFLEVPGFDDDGPDAENIRRLRDLASDTATDIPSNI